MIYLAIILALVVGWKAGRSYSQGEGILEGYQIGYRDAVRNYVEAKGHLNRMRNNIEQDDAEFVEHDGIDYPKRMLN